ncbi:MAG TPA: hypothetical protein VIW67_02535 [Terriglobales bacterium]|jgi:hypothetical protein
MSAEAFFVVLPGIADFHRSWDEERLEQYDPIKIAAISGPWQRKLHVLPGGGNL